MKPLAIDLFCGLGGWSDGLMDAGYYVVGFDNEQHIYGNKHYPAQLVLQDVLTLHGRQFKDAAVIVASPPCQEFSYMAMPWKRGKQIARALRGEGDFPVGYIGSKTIEELNRLFHACFRIQRQACEAANRHIPMVVENVRGAQPWVGRARWNYGSYYLWGDVPALMPIIPKFKSCGMNCSDRTKRGQDFTRLAGQHAIKVQSESGRRTDPGKGARFTSRDCGLEHIKQGGDWVNASQPSISRMYSSKSTARKAASAMIAKIPFDLARHIADCYNPLAKAGGK